MHTSSTNPNPNSDLTLDHPCLSFYAGRQFIYISLATFSPFSVFPNLVVRRTDLKWVLSTTCCHQTSYSPCLQRWNLFGVGLAIDRIKLNTKAFVFGFCLNFPCTNSKIDLLLRIWIKFESSASNHNRILSIHWLSNCIYICTN